MLLAAWSAPRPMLPWHPRQQAADHHKVVKQELQTTWGSGQSLVNAHLPQPQLRTSATCSAATSQQCLDDAHCKAMSTAMRIVQTLHQRCAASKLHSLQRFWARFTTDSSLHGRARPPTCAPSRARATLSTVLHAGRAALTTDGDWSFSSAATPTAACCTVLAVGLAPAASPRKDANVLRTSGDGSSCKH